ncbi:MAG TPA: hypothetical protein VFP78_03650 [Solirubrobacteraceae bacterium]|nr:hypothetical protein [Solirubrobacteraceae bacterium]
MTGGRAVRFAVAVVAAAALAIAAGSWAGSRLAEPEEPAAPPPPPRAVEVGAAKLVVPAGWRSIPLERSGVAGLDPERAVAFAPAGRASTPIVAEFGPVTDASLLPPALSADVLRSTSPPDATRLGGHPAWLYRAAGSERLDLTVLTTTAGVLAIGCPAGNECTKDVEAAGVPGATTLVPSDSLALGLRLPVVVERLDRNRRAHRAALADANALWRQGRLAGRLSTDHAAAADALRTSAGTAGRRLLASLADTATAYSALARAASNRWRNRFIAARQRIKRSEAALTAALADVPQPRAAPALPPKPEPAISIPDIPAPGGVSLLLFAALALLAAAAGVVLGTTGATERLRRVMDELS